MLFEVLSRTYHSPITIEVLTYRVLLGTLAYSASAPGKSDLATVSTSRDSASLAQRTKETFLFVSDSNRM